MFSLCLALLLLPAPGLSGGPDCRECERAVASLYTSFSVIAAYEVMDFTCNTTADCEFPLTIASCQDSADNCYETLGNPFCGLGRFGDQMYRAQLIGAGLILCEFIAGVEFAVFSDLVLAIHSVLQFSYSPTAACTAAGFCDGVVTFKP